MDARGGSRPFSLRFARCTALVGLGVAALGGCRAPGRAETSTATAAEPWTAAEQRAADAAVRVGFAELTDWVDTHPDDAEALGENLVECFLDISYGAGADLRGPARARARAALEPLVRAHLDRSTDDVRADEWLALLALANYARQLWNADDRDRLARLVELANAAGRHGDALDASLGLDADAVLADTGAANDDVYALLMAAITLVEADLLPGIEIPVDAREVPRRLWAFLAAYRLVGAHAYAEGAEDPTFYDTAYLATHVGYLPTGYGRHALAEADAPWLHAFLRDNFDAVLAMGELDLVAEFVDLFRQYGGDERTDTQLRAGARHLLRLFDAAGGSFMRHRESYETDAVDAYDLVHKAWTGIAGLRRRDPEPVVAGTYGAAFHRSVRAAR